MIVLIHVFLLLVWLGAILFLIAKRRWAGWLALMAGFVVLESLLFWFVAMPAFDPDAGNGAVFGAAFLMAPAELVFVLALLGTGLGFAIHFWRDSRSFGTGKTD